MILKISIVLAIVVNVSCAADISGMLSQLYKKAASENRPLVLVLDNDQEDTHQLTHPVKSPAADDNERSLPSSLLELLNQKRQPPQAEQKHRFLDHLLSVHREHENEEKLSNLERLKRKLQREKQRRIEKRERLEQRNRDNQDVNVEKEQRGDFQQKTPRGQDKNQYRLQDRNQPQDQDRDEKEKEKREKRILRSSVITNLLRTYNDLNCEAKNECEDECQVNKGKKKKKCQNKCEVKYECEESVEEDPCDECDESDEKPSTKGEILVTYTEKCKRC